MDTGDFWEKVWLTVLDKGLLAFILLIAGYYLNKVLEEFKGNISRQQEAVRTSNAAVVDLTKKLATGSHIVSWLAWSATEPTVTLTTDDFKSYDKAMIRVLSDLVGLQASVAALDPSRFPVLSEFAEQLYERDIRVGKARDLYKSGDAEKIKQANAILKTAYEESLQFDQALLRSVTGLLAASPAAGPAPAQPA